MGLLSLQDLRLLFLELHPASVMVQLLVLCLPSLYFFLCLGLDAEKPVHEAHELGMLCSLLPQDVFPLVYRLSIGLLNLLLLDVPLLVLLQSLNHSP